MRYDLFYDDSLIDLSVDMITTRSENDYIIGYLHILANLYLSEYNYDEIKPIIANGTMDMAKNISIVFVCINHTVIVTNRLRV